MLSWLDHVLKSNIEQYKLFAIYITMTLESSCIPIPSEIVMPYAGYLVAQGKLTLPVTAFIGALANLSGSWLAYAVGRFGGRTLVDKYGRYIFHSRKHLTKANRWFAKKGEVTVFLSRMLPGVRTFISLPAGIAKMDFAKFSIYSFLGSLPWNFALVYLGFVFTDRWDQLQNYLKDFNVLVLVSLVLVVLGYVFWRKIGVITNTKNRVYDKLAAFGKFGRGLIIGITAAALAILIFGKLAEDVMYHELTFLDTRVTKFVMEYSSQKMTLLMKFITTLGSVEILVPIALLTVFILYKQKKRYWDSLLVVTALSGGWLLDELLKSIFHRPRPEVAMLIKVSGYSFPSGHAMVSVAFYGFLAYLVWLNRFKFRYLAIIGTVMLVILIGISRIYLGVHYPSDVFAGFVAGGFWLTGCILAMQTVRFYRSGLE